MIIIIRSTYFGFAPGLADLLHIADGDRENDQGFSDDDFECTNGNNIDENSLAQSFQKVKINKEKDLSEAKLMNGRAPRASKANALSKISVQMNGENTITETNFREKISSIDRSELLNNIDENL